jgi:hypothetical protein
VASWTVEGDLSPQSCRPRSWPLEFRDQGGFTEVTLTHERFPRVESRDKHKGWSGWLTRWEKLPEVAVAESTTQPA